MGFSQIRTSENNIKIPWQDFVAIGLFIVLLFNIFRLMDAGFLRELAFQTNDWTMYVSAGFLILLAAFFRERTRELMSLYLGVGLYLFVNVVTNFWNGGLFDNPNFLIPVYCLMFFLMTLYIPISQRMLVGYGHIAQAYIIFFLFDWFNTGMPVARFTSLFGNPNVSGIFFGTLFIFTGLAWISSRSFSGRTYFSLGLLASLILIYVSTSRAVYLIVVIMLICYFIKRLFKEKYRYLFLIVMALNMGFVFIYNYLSVTKLGERINDWSLEYLHKNFFSGRQNIWGPSLEHGLEAPFLGHGVGIRPKDFMEGTHYLHSHNVYIQVFLESGLFALAAFGFFLWLIWRILIKEIEEPISQFISYFLIGLLIYQSVEITFFLNMQSIGLLHWFLLGIGIQFALRYEREL